MNKQFKRVFILGLFMLLVVTVLPGYCQSKYEWSMFTSMPAVFSPPKAFKKVLDAVREKTGGNLDIQLFTAGQLPYKMEDTLAIVSKRSVELSEVNNQHVSGYRDWIGLTGQSVVFNDMNEAMEMWSGSVMTWINEQLAKRDNCIALAPIILANQSIWTKNKIASLEDLKGKRIRIPDSAAEELLKSLGAHPVYMQFSEMNEAVMRGTIDGALTGTTMAQENPSHTNIYHYLLLLEVNYSLSYVCVNLEAWKELPVEFQNILRTETINEISKLNKRFFNNIKTVYSYVNNPPPDLTVVELSPEERQRLKENGQAVFNKWMQAKSRSAEAKELWALIEKSRK